MHPNNKPKRGAQRHSIGGPGREARLVVSPLRDDAGSSEGSGSDELHEAEPRSRETKITPRSGRPIRYAAGLITTISSFSMIV